MRQRPFVGLALGAGVMAALWWLAADRLPLSTVIGAYSDMAQFVERRQLASIVLFIVGYAAAAALALPIATVLTLMGGALFGTWLGGAAAVIAATLGACALFGLARGVLNAYFTQKMAGWLDRVSRVFESDAASYLLFARLTPVFPFVVVTLAAALLGARFSTFAWTTLLGIIPGTFAYAFVGAGLHGALIAEAERLSACRAGGAICTTTLNPAAFVTRDIVIGLAVLGAIMLFSIGAKRLLARPAANAARD